MISRRFFFSIVLLAVLVCSGCVRRQYLPLAAKQYSAPGQPHAGQGLQPSESALPTATEALVILTKTADSLGQAAGEATLATPTAGQTAQAKIMLPYLSKPALPTLPPWRLVPHIVQGNKQNDRFILQLEYPIVTGGADPRLDGLTQQVQNWINRETDQFLQNIQAATPADVNGFMYSTYAVPSSAAWSPDNPQPNIQPSPPELEASQAIWNGGKPVVSILFTINEYYGGVHPNQRHAAINFDLEAGRPLELGDLFLPSADYLSALARYAAAELYRRPGLVPQEIERGAAPAIENYNLWNITPMGLLITFEEYQVGPYAAGPQQVLIPYRALAEILRPDGPAGRTNPP